MIDRDGPRREDGETLKDRIEGPIHRLEVMGGRAGIVVYEKALDHVVPAILIDHNPNEPFFAASTNKLAIAFALAHERSGHGHALRSLAVRERQQGAGKFDVDNPNQESPIINATEISLLDDMLRNSGNTAAKILKEELGADRINELLRQYGHEEVQLFINPDDGSSHLGSATPEGLVKLLSNVSYGEVEAEEVFTETSYKALAENSRPTGIRRDLSAEEQSLMLGNGIQLLNKTGEYGGDESVGAPVRHDVGLIVSQDGRYKLAYAFMSQSPSAFIAELTRHQVTAEILEHATGIKKSGITKAIARKAMHNLGIGSRDKSHLHLL